MRKEFPRPAHLFLNDGGNRPFAATAEETERAFGAVWEWSGAATKVNPDNVNAAKANANEAKLSHDNFYRGQFGEPGRRARQHSPEPGFGGQWFKSALGYFFQHPPPRASQKSTVVIIRRSVLQSLP